MNIQSFRSPRELFHGFGALEALTGIAAKRACIVSDRGSMGKHGFLEHAEACLRQGGAACDVIDDVDREPTLESVLSKTDRIRSFEPDLIVALGGGSVMDVAKMLRIVREHPDLPISLAAGSMQVPQLRGICALAAVPSTSGTGSEATCAAVLIDRGSKLKKVFISPSCIPEIVVLDTELTLSMPKAVTVDSGFDALVHALEAFTAKNASELTKPLALEAARLAFENLPVVCENGADRKGRACMHKASFYAGLAIGNSSVGLAHSLDQIGPIFGIAHGRVLGVLFPYVMEYNLKNAESEYAEIADAVGIRGNTAGEKAERLCAMIEKIRKDVGIPSCFAALGLDRKEFDEAVLRTAAAAESAFASRQNPRTATVPDMKKILEYAFEQRRVDF